MVLSEGAAWRLEEHGPKQKDVWVVRLHACLTVFLRSRLYKPRPMEELLACFAFVAVLRGICMLLVQAMLRPQMPLTCALLRQLVFVRNAGGLPIFSDCVWVLRPVPTVSVERQDTYLKVSVLFRLVHFPWHVRDKFSSVRACSPGLGSFLHAIRCPQPPVGI